MKLNKYYFSAVQPSLTLYDEMPCTWYRQMHAYTYSTYLDICHKIVCFGRIARVLHFVCIIPAIMQTVANSVNNSRKKI